MKPHFRVPQPSPTCLRREDSGPARRGPAACGQRGGTGGSRGRVPLSPPPPHPGQPRGARTLTAGAAAPPAARATGRGTFSARAGEGPRRKGLKAATPTPTPSLAAPHLF